MNWELKGKEVSLNTPPSVVYGFIYLITYTNGQKYIGQKKIWSVTKKKFGKKKLATVTDRRLKTYDVIVKENDWRTYNGSSKNTKEFTIESKVILELCKDKINLTYAELKWIILYDALISSMFMNDNILGKFYSGKIEKGTIDGRRQKL